MQSKLIVTAVGSFGLGALVGWVITADRADRLLRDTERNIFFLEERTSNLESFIDNVTGLKNETSSWEENPNQPALLDLHSSESEEPIATIEVPNDDVPEGETPEETRTNLQNIINAYTADPDVQEEFVDKAIRAKEYDKSPPFVISREEFAYGEEGQHFEKITLTYYPRDRVLLDDDEDPENDIPQIVGWRSLQQFGGESGDPDVVFVRNRRLMTDFEVVKEEDTELPLHVKYGMNKEAFRVSKAAGLIKLRQEDE